jgi:hypothetical protein
MVIKIFIKYLVQQFNSLRCSVPFTVQPRNKKNYGRNNSQRMLHRLQINVAAQFKVWEYGRSLAGIVVWGGVSPSVVSICVVRQSSVLLADHLGRGVLPSVLCVIKGASGRGVIPRRMSIHDAEIITHST